MEYKKEYEKWLASEYVDEQTKEELKALAQSPAAEANIEDRFHKSLEFGTGGLRGIMGAGSNRMNIYTIRTATQGLANYILAEAQKPGQEGLVAQGVAIAYDSRYNSEAFANEAALVLNGNGIPAYLFNSLRTTPFLSFAVRYLGCTAGIMVTASHNPKTYNGYKVYWSDGAQVVYPRDEDIITEVGKITDFSHIQRMELQKARDVSLYRMAGSDVDEEFINSVVSMADLAISRGCNLPIVYTPLHGGGSASVGKVLETAGFTNVHLVREQAQPDPEFSTIASPNPEDAEAFSLALGLAKEVGAELVMASDPDADRLGVYVKDPDGGYVMLTGNMIGVLIAEYMLSRRKQLGILNPNGVIISTIVSTRMVKKIALAFGIGHEQVLTGFKYIGEKIRGYEETGIGEFVFGFEESYGYLAGSYARDKDSAVAALLFSELCAVNAEKGISIPEALEELYKKYGYFKEATRSLAFDGLAGLTKMRAIMSGLRARPTRGIAGINVTSVADYLNDELRNLDTGKAESTGLPASDVLLYELEDGSWFAVRPSGTEPKMKVYFGAGGTSQDEVDAKLKKMATEVMNIIHEM